MGRYTLVRLGRGVLTLLFVSVLVFMLARLSGDPLDTLSPDALPEKDRVALVAKWGLDHPVVEQYWTFLKNAAQGDFGISFKNPGTSATGLIASRIPASVKVGLVAIFLELVIAVPIGILAAVKRGKLIDRFARGLALFGQSVPEFWLGIVFIWIFAVRLGWFPTSGMGGLRSYVLPGVTLALFGIAALTRLFRSSILDTLDTEFVKLARLKGLSEKRVVGKHVLKASIISPATFFSYLLVHLITGTAVVEVVFSWPGVGLLAYQSANARDFPVVQAIALYVSAVIILLNLAVDLFYAWVDPRVRLGGKAIG
jgi:peptide/nickel transport system permease protein